MLKPKRHIILVISFLLVTGFLVTALASFFVSRTSLRKEIAQNELPLTSDNIYSEIQRDLLRPIFISSVMAQDTFLRDWVVEGETQPDKITRYLEEIQKKYNTLTSFFVSEKTRRYYQAKGILKTVKPDEKRDTWYFRVREMTPIYEINIDPDMANKDKMTIFVNYKVFDFRGNFIGATGVGLEIKAVRQLIENYQQRYKRQIFFINKQGDVTLAGTALSGRTSNIREMEGMANLADKILTTENESFIFERNGDTIHLNSRFIPEFDWYLLVEQSEKPALENIHQALFLNLVICTIITAIVLLITHLTISNYQGKLEKLAITDNLTGIFNRHGFDILFDQTMKEAPRKKAPFSIILFDIDHFKKINDDFGHTIGDNVLKHIVQTTWENIRAEDIFCRWGGDEFLVLLKGCRIDGAHMLAEKIRLAVKKAPFLMTGGKIELSLSLGVTEFIADETEVSLFKRADQLLYRAKQNGRDRSEK